MATASTNTTGRNTASAPTTTEIVSDSLAIGVMFALVLTVVSRVIGFARGILFCGLMTPQELGQWSMVWSFIMTLAPFAVLGLPGCFGRYVEYYRQRGQMGQFVRRIAMVSLAMTSALAASIFLCSDIYSYAVFRESTPTTNGIIYCIGFVLVAVTAMNFLISLVESLRQIRLATLMRFILGIVFAAVGVGLLMTWENATAAAAIAYGVACTAASIPAVWFLFKHREKFDNSGELLPQATMWTRIAPFALWLWCSNLCHNLFEVTDRYMLIHWSPVDASVAQGFVGQYHSGRVIPLLMVSVATMLGGLLMPYMSAAWEKGNRERSRIQLNWTIKLMAIAFTVGGMLSIFLAPLLFDGVLQGRYNDGLAVLPLTLVYCIWFSLFVVGQDYLWVAEKGKWAFGAVAMGLLVNVVLNVLLIPSYGLWGAVVATAIANGTNVVIVYLLNHRFGCTNDIGVWLTGLVPLVLLMPVHYGVMALSVIAFASFKTRLVFNQAEMKQFKAAYSKTLAKIKASRFRS